MLSGNFTWGVGVIEDRNDPDKLGRFRVRILGAHTENKNNIPTEELPWATSIQPITSSSMNGIGTSPTGIVEGSWVLVFFRDGSNMQDPVILGTLAGIPIEQLPPTEGFTDPNVNKGTQPPSSVTYTEDGSGGTFEEGSYNGYPRISHLKESDTNRLARSEKISETIIQSKKNGAQSGIDTSARHQFGSQTGGSEPFDEPPTEYAAIYPMNHVMESESGHIKEVDDTSGSERLHDYHRSGTFKEVHPNGTVVNKIVQDNYTLILKDDHVHIDGKCYVTIDKGTKLLVNRDKEGNHLDIEIAATGDMNITVNQGNVNLNLLDGDMNTYINGNLNEWITGNVKRLVEGDSKETIKGDSSITVEGEQSTLIEGKNKLTMQSNYDIFVQSEKKEVVLGTSKFTTTGRHDIFSTNYVNIFGAFVMINPKASG